jgi:hypothetical protein
MKEPPAPTPTLVPYLLLELTRLDISRCSVTFHWIWSGTSAESEWFTPGVGVTDTEPLHSVAWMKERTRTPTPRKAGEYTWEIAIHRDDLTTGRCEQLDINGRDTLGFGGSASPP